MTTEASRKTKARFDKLNTRHYGIKLNKRTDKEVIEFLDNSGNVMGTIRRALRLLMEQERKEGEV